MASKFQEMGGILDFVPWNLNSFPCNFFFVRWNFYFLGRFLHSKPWFLYESAQFSSERREIPKKTRCFPAKTSGSCEIQKRWESIISDQLFWICKRRVKLGGQNGESFLSTEGLHLILFSVFRFHSANISTPQTIQAIYQSIEQIISTHILIHQIRQSVNPLYAPIHRTFQATQQEIRLNPKCRFSLMYV